jgi:hypothetical protein
MFSDYHDDSASVKNSIIPAGMPDPIEREANPEPWMVTY